jgi:hypothetical protein
MSKGLDQSAVLISPSETENVSFAARNTSVTSCVILTSLQISLIKNFKIYIFVIFPSLTMQLFKAGGL